jgi:ABC-type sugar transport system ATPase subunit
LALRASGFLLVLVWWPVGDRDSPDGRKRLARVELRGVGKVYAGGIEALHPLDLTIEDGSLFVIVGPSGAGKSTLLRLIAGLEPLTAGSVWVDGRRVDEMAPRARDLAMVFQTPVVYPYLSVFENLAFGLRARGAARSEVERVVSEIAAVLGLNELLERRPATLSGGQRQRVALGRALVRRPRILLLDEPFASLDAPLRTALRTELVELQRRLGTTMIHVTHDQAEALALGSRIAVLRAGNVVQSGAPLDVYERPACRFVGEFIGTPPMNFVRCAVEIVDGAGELRIAGSPAATTTAWRFDGGWRWAVPLVRRGSGPVDLGIRAEHVRELVRSDDERLVARGLIRRLEPQGAQTLAIVAVDGQSLALWLPARTPFTAGAPIQVALDAAGIVWFDPASGRALV